MTVCREKKDSDVVIVDYGRTPVCKAKRGMFREYGNDYLLFFVLKNIVNRNFKVGDKIGESGIYGGGVDMKYKQRDEIEGDKVCVEEIGDIIFGNVLAPAGGSMTLRMACIHAGIPYTTPFLTLNRQCGSGLEALEVLSGKLKNNRIKIGICGGFEFMTKDSLSVKYDVSTELYLDDRVKKCLLPMGETAENICKKHNYTRKDCDIIGYLSHKKALKAAKDLRYSEQIIPIPVSDKGKVYKLDSENISDDSLSKINTSGIDNINEENFVTEDEGMRVCDVEGLGKLKPAFLVDGVCTAGNSSQLSDGACGMLVTTRDFAREKNLSIKSIFVDYCCVGVDPSLMGIGPVSAVKKLLENNKLGIEDISLWEINEAFGVVLAYCIQELGIKIEKVNKWGGSIAIGHPVGSSGARLVGNLICGLESGCYGVVTLCCGGGMGVAALFYKE
ncbi:acetyl-CoA C-acyltransferase [Hamiltosporidium magnivora]|uniref:acetyl-CoA C-acyltransferase n=1 Tax=Hamiltosporidium magnivora TaxID=148818 RepID=A0A4Q9LLS0_9MICR|nr:acetyl-CoA C-acyltransferase [Hamiltosporidium magnivora]